MDHVPQGSSIWSYVGCNPAVFLSYQVDIWYICWIAALVGTNLGTLIYSILVDYPLHQGCPDPILVGRNQAGFGSGHPCSPENFKALPKVL